MVKIYVNPTYLGGGGQNDPQHHIFAYKIQTLYTEKFKLLEFSYFLDSLYEKIFSQILLDFNTYYDVSRGKLTTRPQLYIPKLYCACARGNDYGRVFNPLTPSSFAPYSL